LKLSQYLDAGLVSNQVNRRQVWLVLGWVFDQTISVCSWRPRSTQPGHPSVGRRSEYQRKQGCKQARCSMHYPHVHGLAA